MLGIVGHVYKHACNGIKCKFHKRGCHFRDSHKIYTLLTKKKAIDILLDNVVRAIFLAIITLNSIQVSE